MQAVGELQELQRRRAVQVMQGMLEEAGQDETGKAEMEEREEATNGELPHALLGSAQALPARPQLAHWLMALWGSDRPGSDGPLGQEGLLIHTPPDAQHHHCYCTLLPRPSTCFRQPPAPR